MIQVKLDSDFNIIEHNSKSNDQAEILLKYSRCIFLYWEKLLGESKFEKDSQYRFGQAV